MNRNYALQVPVVNSNIQNVNSCAIVTSSVTRAISYCDVILTDCSGPVPKDAMALLTKTSRHGGSSPTSLSMFMASYSW